jgi:septum formation protein
VRLFVLASASPRRVELLRQAGYSFEVRPAEIAEVTSSDLSPVELTSWNALRKARHVATGIPQAVVLGADTVVSLGEKVFGKPASLALAKEMIRELRGRTHTVTTAYCLICAEQGRSFLGYERTLVTLKLLSDVEIDAYHAMISPLDKAGAYAAQTSPERIITKVEGLYSTVVGLPVEELEGPLARFSVVRGAFRVSR